MIEHVYEKIEKLKKSEKANKHLIVMVDWNAVVGEEESGSVIGRQGTQNLTRCISMSKH